MHNKFCKFKIINITKYIGKSECYYSENKSHNSYIM